MDEKILKQSEAQYFKSVTKVLKGQLTMTTDRIRYSGIQDRAQFDHGAVGNIIRDKMESAMGYDNLPEELIFDIPLKDVKHELKRFGLSKRLVIIDKDGNEYKLAIHPKAERNSWPEAIDSSK